MSELLALNAMQISKPNVLVNELLATNAAQGSTAVKSLVNELLATNAIHGST